MFAIDAATTPATSVGIGEKEYAIAIYRPRVRPGRLKLNVRNLGVGPAHRKFHCVFKDSRAK